MSLPPGFLARPFAHRALHGAGRAENSASSIAAAVAGGWGIEIDVQLSADGRAMVFHDDRLERLTGTEGELRAMTAAELGRLPLRGGGGTIPTLEDALAQIGGRVALLVEIKDRSGTLTATDGRLEEAVATALAGQSNVAVMSFNPGIVARMRALAPGVPRGLTTCAFAAEDWPTLPAERRASLAAIAEYESVGASFVSHRHDRLDTAPITTLKARGAGILCWTVRNEAEARAALRVADQITFEGFRPGSSPRAA